MRDSLHSPWATALLVVLVGSAIGLVGDFELLTAQQVFVAHTVLLLAYLATQVHRLHRVSPERWLLNPAVLCSAVTFAIGFGITNVMYFFPEDALAAVGASLDVTPAMSKLMFLVLLGAVGMWLGYWSGTGRALGAWLSRRAWLERVLRRQFEPRIWVLPALVLASLISRLVQIHLGIYGYSSDLERLNETASIRQYLTLMDWLGRLALTIAALRYYSPSPTRGAKAWLVGVLAYELCFGFVSGFKSAVAIPIAIVGFCKYLRAGRIPWRWIAAFPVALFAAYAIIQPFRAARYEESQFQGTSLSDIAGTMLLASLSEQGPKVEAENAGIALQFLSRSTMTYMASLGIEFADSRPLPAGSPAFLPDIFAAPLYALIPRALWPSKESQRHGAWYRTEVMGFGEDDATSVGMSPVTYLYFAGGGLAVALGFFAIGVAQRAWAQRFLLSGGAGAALVFLAGLHSLAMPDNVYYSWIIEFLRVVPATLFLQYVMFRR